ncbi:MAG: hypothetical protein HOP29_00770 [Phycisphaerales bacterium]|nr:hypothetical protein [Phycisphaerales bacterium]
MVRRLTALGLLSQVVLYGAGGCFSRDLVFTAAAESLAFTVSGALQAILNGLLAGA